EKKIVRKETRVYQGRLQEEINQDRENNGKKPFSPNLSKVSRQRCRQRLGCFFPIISRLFPGQ
ncbi:hypothetical protein ACWF5S_29945, partial [Peribacillus butanolivorans]